MYFFNLSLLLFSLGSRVLCADIKDDLDAQSDDAIPYLEDPIVVNSECMLQKEGKVKTSTGELPECRKHKDGMSNCCQCVYGLHYRTLLQWMGDLWEQYGLEGGGRDRLGKTHLQAPNPADLGPIDMQHLFEADDAHLNPARATAFRCYLLISREQQAMFYTALQFYRNPKTRSYHKRKGLAMRSKQLRINCGSDLESRPKSFPSLRDHGEEVLSITGLTGQPRTTQSAMCVDRNEPPTERWPERTEDHNRNKRTRYTIDSNIPIVRTGFIELPVLAGTSTCIDFATPQVSASVIPSSAMQITAAILSEKNKGKATYDDPYEISSEDDDYTAHMDEEQIDLQQAIAGSYEQQESTINSLRLVSTSYDSLYPGQYVTRTLQEAGPSNYLDFTLPRVAVPNLNEPPPEDENGLDLELSLKVCASVSASSSQPALLATEYQFLPKP